MRFFAPFHFEFGKNWFGGNAGMLATIQFIDFFNFNFDLKSLNFWKKLDADRVRAFLAGEPVEVLIICNGYTLKEVLGESALPCTIESKVDGAITAAVEILEVCEGMDVPQSIFAKYKLDFENAKMKWKGEKNIYIRAVIRLKSVPALKRRRPRIAHFGKDENSIACLREVLEHIGDYYIHSVKNTFGCTCNTIIRKSQNANYGEMFVKSWANYKRVLKFPRMIDVLVKSYPDRDRIALLKSGLGNLGKQTRFTKRKTFALQIPESSKATWEWATFKWTFKFCYSYTWNNKVEPDSFFKMSSYLQSMSRYVENIRNCPDVSKWKQFGNYHFNASLELYANVFSSPKKTLADKKMLARLEEESFFVEQYQNVLKECVAVMEGERRRLAQFQDILVNIFRDELKEFSLTELNLKEMRKTLARFLLEDIQLNPADYLNDEDPIVSAYAKSLVMGIEFLP